MDGVTRLDCMRKAEEFKVCVMIITYMWFVYDGILDT